MSINRVNISGYLTRDCELRATQGGTQILGFGMAVNDRRRNQQTGEWEDIPNFVDCVAFGARAEALSKILKKGMKVAVDGKLRYSSWEKDGQRRSKLEVVAEEIELMQQRQNDSEASRAQGPQQSGNYTGQAQNGPQTASQPPAQPSYGYATYYDSPF